MRACSRRNNALLVSLKAVLAQPLPSSEQTYECAACLHQLSWVMRLEVRAPCAWVARPLHHCTVCVCLCVCWLGVA